MRIQAVTFRGSRFTKLDEKWTNEQETVLADEKSSLAQQDGNKYEKPQLKARESVKRILIGFERPVSYTETHHDDS